jgi:PBSX family phage terminase large subunit
MTSASKSILPEFNQKLDMEQDHHYFDITAKEVHNKFSGSKIIFSGIKTSSGNQTASLKGIQGLTTFIVDEAEEWVSDEEFLKLRGSIRTKGVQNRIIIVMNPSDVDHWIYKMFIEKTHKIRTVKDEFGTYDVQISTHPEVEHIHTTYLDNLEHLDESFHKFRKDLYDYQPDNYANIVMGEWATQQEGALFPKNELRYFNPNENYEFETSLAYADIADEGTDSTSVPFSRNIGSDIYITDVLFSPLTSEYTIPLVIQKGKEQQLKYIRVESNAMGAMYSRNLSNQCNGSFEVLTARSTTNKHTRIMMDAGFIKRHCVFIAPEYQSEEYKAFMKELCIYNKDPQINKGKHDDAPDSMSGLAIFIRGMLPHLYL